MIATKVNSLPKRPGLSPDNVRAAVDESLARLRTDYLDVYYAHRDDTDVPQDEYVGVFSDVELRARAAEERRGDRRGRGPGPFTVAQDHFNLVERDYAETLAPTVAELGLVELPYYSLASGFLTGKYRPGAAVESSRAGGAGVYLDDPRNVTLLDALDTIASDRGVSVNAVSLARSSRSRHWSSRSTWS